MADDADRTLARLAVDAGFLTRDEALRYWQQCQAPGSPRFIQLLVQSRRLSPADVNQLRALWQRASSGATPALGPGGTNGGAVAVAAPPASVAMASGPGPPATNLQSTDDGSWEEALEKDTQLARVLFTRGLVTQDRLRECRALQLQHRLRLGVVLVKKGYADPAAIDEASGAARGPASATGSHARPSGPTSASHGRPGPAPNASGRLQRPPTNPFLQAPAGPGGPIDQDAMPTLNVAPGAFPPGSPMTPRAPIGPQDAIPTILGGGAASVEELNPFAMGLVDAPRSSGPGPGRGGPGGPPLGLAGQLSRDELNAFDDVPLGAPPSPGAGPGAFLPGGSAAEGDITMPPGYTPEGFAGPAPGEGPSKRPSQAEAHLPDSGGEKPAAPKKKKNALRQGPPPSSGSGRRLALMLLAGGVLIAIAAIAAWGLGVFE